MSTEIQPRRSLTEQVREIFASDRCPICGALKREREDMFCKMCYWALPKNLQKAIRWKPKGWIVKWLEAVAMLKKDRETNHG